jgi:UDP-4-amino-4,6-dideoxy-N-acetyl-beta-L-altrosamine N-acetyltransferase
MIELRGVLGADRELLREWRNLPHISQHMFTSHEIGIDEHNRWFERAMADPSRRDWIIMFKEQSVGLVSIFDIDVENSRARWGFYVADPKLPGVGAIVEFKILEHVFDEMDLHKLACEVLTTNPSTIAVHEKFGFAVDGTARDEIRRDGEFIDVVHLSILNQEWRAVEPQMRVMLRM